MGYTYCILDSFSKEYVAIKHVGYGTEVTDADLYDKIKDNLAADAFLSKSYKSVDMIYVTRKSIIVPNPMFDKTKLKDLVSANFTISDKEEIQFNKLKSISACNVFVIPSLSDNLPNTIMEALACGVPCVGFNVGGIPEMIDQQKNGYVAKYRSADDLAAGIYWTLHEADHQQLSREAVNKVERNYSQQNVAVKYIEVYTNAIAQRTFRI